MLLSILQGQNNPVLRQKAEIIKEITPEIKRLVSDMAETIKDKQGLGLAAPQVGRGLRIIVVSTPLPLVLINPQISKSSFRREAMEEGCLSLPGLYLPVKRAKKVTVRAHDLNGQEIQIKAQDLLARVLQHEIDHLDGILITDR